MSRALVATWALAVIGLLMVGELRVSRRNERRLRAQGALEPPDPVYAAMQWAYPGVFVAMAIEGGMAGPAPGMATIVGVVTTVAAKALKFWAIATLGTRWTYKVLVLPGVPLVDRGPYRFTRHPNYVAVIGELVGMALMTGARAAGVAGTVLFASLLYRRIAAEERALGV
jgi:methyltransferase